MITKKCDKCGDVIYETKSHCTTIVYGLNSPNIDLCEICTEEFKEWLKEI